MPVKEDVEEELVQEEANTVEVSLIDYQFLVLYQLDKKLYNQKENTEKVQDTDAIVVLEDKFK